MKHFILFMVMTLNGSLAFAEMGSIKAGLEFESDLFPQTAATLSFAVGERSDIGFRLGIQGYQVAKASGMERESVKHYALTYASQSPLIAELLNYQIGFALGQNHAPEAVGRSRYAFYELSQGLGFKQGRARFSTDVVARFNGINGDEVVTVGGKTVPSLNVFPRFGFSIAFK